MHQPHTRPKRLSIEEAERRYREILKEVEKIEKVYTGFSGFFARRILWENFVDDVKILEDLSDELHDIRNFPASVQLKAINYTNGHIYNIDKLTHNELAHMDPDTLSKRTVLLENRIEKFLWKYYYKKS